MHASKTAGEIILFLPTSILRSLPKRQRRLPSPFSTEMVMATFRGPRLKQPYRACIKNVGSCLARCGMLAKPSRPYTISSYFLLELYYFSSAWVCSALRLASHWRAYTRLESRLVSSSRALQVKLLMRSCSCSLPSMFPLEVSHISYTYVWVISPFDTGDRCFIDQENLVVKKVGLFAVSGTFLAIWSHIDSRLSDCFCPRRWNRNLLL